MALARVRIPNADTCVKTSRRYPLTIKGDRIYLTEMAGEGTQTSAFRYTPNASGGIIATGNDNIPMNSKASDTCLMSHKDIPTCTCCQIPNAQG